MTTSTAEVGASSQAGMSCARLQAFIDTWLRGEVDGLSEFITDDCVYVSTTGPDPGRRVEGRAAVLQAFAEMLPEPGDGTRFGEVFISGSRGCVEWSIGGEGTDVPFVRGCDVFTFRGDRVCRKDAFRKAEA